MVYRDPQEASDPAHLAMAPLEANPPLDDEGLPPLRTWMTIAEEAALLDHFYAYQIYLNHCDDDWDATLCLWTRLAEAEQNPNYDAKEAMF
jgi:hypothetical protein